MEVGMHVQVVNFNLKDISEEEFRTVCDQVAPAFAEVPGLIAKIWLASPETNTYGGVYLWSDRAAMEVFAGSELFAAVASNPNFANLSARDYGVLEEYTRTTRGLVAAAA
jgi:heme-degrading monooxygenase HmoA